MEKRQRKNIVNMIKKTGTVKCLRKIFKMGYIPSHGLTLYASKKANCFANPGFGKNMTVNPLGKYSV